MEEYMLNLKEKQHNIGFPTFKLPVSTTCVYTYFMTDPLNIIFADFGIWLLGYRYKFSCLYIPQALHKCVLAIKYRWIWILLDFERKSIFKN